MKNNLKFLHLLLLLISMSCGEDFDDGDDSSDDDQDEESTGGTSGGTTGGTTGGGTTLDIGGSFGGTVGGTVGTTGGTVGGTVGGGTGGDFGGTTLTTLGGLGGGSILTHGSLLQEAVNCYADTEEVPVRSAFTLIKRGEEISVFICPTDKECKNDSEVPLQHGTNGKCLRAMNFELCVQDGPERISSLMGELITVLVKDKGVETKFACQEKILRFL